MFYTHDRLDRADHLRKRASQIDELLHAPNSEVVVVWRGKSLVGDHAVGGKNLPAAATIPALVLAKELDLSNAIFLGQLGQRAIFALSVSALNDTELNLLIELSNANNAELTQIRFDDLRAIGPLLSKNDGALLAYARGLVYWNDSCRFCSRCGASLTFSQAGHVKVCSSSECTHQSFPRTDPAVIMLVTHPASASEPARCLMGRNKNWPKGVYSTLAGFVETGESLEQAVQREVKEEANIDTKNVTYIASQPWPFPRSIMLGFEATATSTEITCDPDELEDAQWFTAEQIANAGSWGDARFELQLPRDDSIARFLINGWMRRKANR